MKLRSVAVVIVSFMKTLVRCKSQRPNIRRRAGHGSNEKSDDALVYIYYLS